MNITLTIPDAVATRVVDVLATRFGYQATIPDPADSTKTITNPQTKAQFAKSQLIKWVMAQVSEHEANTAGAAASRTAATSTATDIAIT
jgi:hypothetical protein